MHPRRLPIVASLALTLLAAACADGAGRDAAPMPPATATSPTLASPSPTLEESPEAAPRVPRELRFRAPALSGGQIRGREFAGRDLVIWFWAPW